VEILEQHFPTYHIRDAEEMDGPGSIQHFNQWDKELKKTQQWLPKDNHPVNIAITSGASCPDVLVDEVMLEILSFYEDTRAVDEVIEPFEKELEVEA
jgi:4-hydroxy-3-methylbut-2-enyl diphosphate reductase